MREAEQLCCGNCTFFLPNGIHMPFGRCEIKQKDVSIYDACEKPRDYDLDAVVTPQTIKIFGDRTHYEE